MRQLCFGAVAFCVLAAGVANVRADADQETQAIIDKAIKAAGGEAKLAKLKAVTLKTKATLRHGDVESSFSGEWSFSGLDKFSCEGEVDGTQQRLVLNAKGGWRKVGERVQEAHADGLPSVRKLLYGMRGAQMLLPLKDKAVTRSHLGEIKVAGRPAVGVRAAHKDHGEADIYFDKETGLPAKFEARVVWGPDKKECPFACVFADYKEVEGIKYFTKITITTEANGLKGSLEATISDIKTVAQLGDDLFVKPE